MGSSARSIAVRHSVASRQTRNPTLALISRSRSSTYILYMESIRGDSCFPIVAGKDAGSQRACAIIRRMLFTRSERLVIALTVVGVAAAGVTHYAGIGGTVVPFVLAGVALALLASLVG